MRLIRGQRPGGFLPGLSILVLTSMLSACGFHLRGDVPIAPVLQQTHISGAAVFSDLYVEIKRRLERAGAKVSDTPLSTDTVLAIISDQLNRRVLSVDALGRASEYELTYSVEFDVHDPKGTLLVPRQSVNQLRDYKFDPNNVLAKDTEEVTLRKALVAAAVQQMLRRIDAELKHPPPDILPPSEKTHENPS